MGFRDEYCPQDSKETDIEFLSDKSIGNETESGVLTVHRPKGPHRSTDSKSRIVYIARNIDRRCATAV